MPTVNQKLYMIIRSKALRELASECNIPDQIVDNHFDALIQLVWCVAKKERGRCQTKIRKWQFSDDIGKPSILEVLRDEDEYDLL